ncbi:7-cyano-7-deazaguanine synthase QueC [Phycisphaera mikurensis]|uniref:7-cyano-7-deazaguanine synthase n=1 Tax=Phycisphaera mikurensis (strain NBRC 102666 / KCTC 22515 / FYK2301M01) TaxID=1142394 RepID=I0IDJ2_PHYMF|nr:7-cyano-7-deazaguanine synthase QueC [Phycisphaera mikurensis]MBB6441150.1 7-cyano-7-deazaguanine synthase [Phycisphaera mikurensis]BAM03330.1 7-cyano-7-deazaguanine synthase [Phycisphaera mikurensis NBRC 102666]
MEADTAPAPSGTPTPPIRRAVVLLSGGLDSATVLAIAKREGFRVTALSFRYGQRHGDELAAAARVADAAGVADHRVVDLDLSAFGGSALTDAAIEVPQRDGQQPPDPGIPPTYVPARNTVFLSVALALAEATGARDLFIGVNAVDYSGYPDCRPAFVEAFERLANLATRAGVEASPTGGFRVHAPLIRLSKAEIIRRGTALGVDYGDTLSCYAPAASGRACGRCDACHLRAAGFREAGLTDPAASTP